MTTSREIRLKSRPNGMPDASNFELASVNLPPPGAGQVQVRNRWMSVDPYMRPRMNDEKSYIPPFEVGAVLQGAAIGEVMISNDASLKAGDLVRSFNGWRESFNATPAEVQKLDPRGLPPEAYLGAAGGTGFTAYVGLLHVAAMKEGDVVFVSGAAGAVGSMVCQIAKLKGHKVIASAGGADKVGFVKNELGADAAIDYKATTDLSAALAKAAPDGIDVYFDNVGGDHLEAAIASARQSARFAICGMIGQYNATVRPNAPRNLFMVVTKSLRLEGFIVSNYVKHRAAFEQDLAAWYAAGKIKSRETVFNGIEQAPNAFLGLFKGANIGKMLVKL